MTSIIFAPITARGGAVFVIRISGEGCLERFFNNIKTNKNIQDVKEKFAHLVKIFYKNKKENEEYLHLDDVILIYFKDKKSFTGEDTIEISLHGGNFIIDKFLQMLNEIEGFRFAENGEFTRRALLNGKIDLLQAESINSIIKAENRNQHLLSSQFFSGNISNIYHELKVKIINLMSKIEVFIDFPDDDIPPDVLNDIDDLKKNIVSHLRQCQNINNINQLQNTIKVGFFGNPNCGKSSLLNALSRRDVAIVSNIKGTTRDILTNEIKIKDEKIIICDTAGIREAKNKIEQEGVKRTLSILDNVDIRIFLFDCNNFLDKIKKNDFPKILEIIKNNNFRDEDIILMTKSDLIKQNKEKYNQIISFWKDCNINITEQNIVFFSIFDTENLDFLENIIYKIIKKIKPEIISSLILNNRHFAITQQIENEIQKIDVQKDIELIAEDLRNILFLIQEITGEIRTDDILDKIFRDFCIGK